MKKKLGYKLIGGILLYGVISFLIVASLVEWMFHEKAQSTEATRLYREALAVTSNYAADYYRNRLTLEELAMQMDVLSVYTEGEIWVVNRSGTVLIGRQEGEEAYEIPGFHIADFGTKYYRTGTFYDCFEEPVLTVFAPITINYKVQGYVMVHKSIQQIYKSADHFLNLSYMALVALLLINIAFMGVYLWRTYWRIRMMNRVARKYMEGDFETAMVDEYEDELGFLCAAFNYMANELNTLEDDQRKFVSNISHDFRSPLTSIKGYAEAMLDGTIPVEMKERSAGVSSISFSRSVYYMIKVTLAILIERLR